MSSFSKHIVLLFLYISFFVSFSQDTNQLKIVESTEEVLKEVDQLTPLVYKERYHEEDLFFKVVDNYGNKFEQLYGTRNMRPILHGIAYRGGANNYYHKTNKRKNQNPLPNDGLINLCQEGFSSSIYLYRTNADTSANEVQCNCIDGNKNKMDYMQLDYDNPSHIYEMLKQVYEIAIDSTKGPVYLHCWNGWHASGYLAALMLKQFCGYNDVDAVDYWDIATDGANTSPHYQIIRKKIRQFEPYPEFMISDSLGNKVCPQMPTIVDKTKSHLDIEQLLMVPEAVPINAHIILYDVIFVPNSASISNLDSLTEIKTLIEVMGKYPDLKIEIGGHTDKSGNEDKNKSLSTNRAKFIYESLLKHNISKERLSYKGYGSSMPAYTNKTKEGRDANRRIEVKILEKTTWVDTALVNESYYKENYLTLENAAVNKIEANQSYVLSSIHFEPNKTAFTDTNNRDIRLVISLLKEFPEMILEVGSYTDISGIKEKNDSLSDERAKAIFDLLIESGVDPNRLSCRGYGPLNPIADNNYLWGRERNRRIEIKVLSLKASKL